MTLLSRIQAVIRNKGWEIIPRVYQLTIGGTNIIIIAEEELTLIDTGLPGSSTQIVNFIHSLGRSMTEVSLIIVTHHHFDHIGGLAELRKLTKARVAAHQADIIDIEGQAPYPGVVRKLLQVPPFSALHSVFSLQSSEVDIQLTGGEILKPLGGLQVIHTPGHTLGSISLYSPSNKLLIVGDAINKRYQTPHLPPKMVSTDLVQALDSAKRLAELDFNTLCCGHGRPLTKGRLYFRPPSELRWLKQ